MITDLIPLEWTNGFIVKQALQLGFLCPEEHLRMWKYITKKTRESAHYMQDRMEERHAEELGEECARHAANKEQECDHSVMF